MCYVQNQLWGSLLRIVNQGDAQGGKRGSGVELLSKGPLRLCLGDLGGEGGTEMEASPQDTSTGQHQTCDARASATRPLEKREFLPSYSEP